MKKTLTNLYPAKAWNEYSKTPIEKTEKLDAFYELLIDKLNNADK